MTTIHAMLKRVKSVDLQTIGVNIVVDNKIELLDLNKDQLLNDGMNKNMVKLRSYRSASYARRKNQRNPSPGLGTPDLYNTGAFQDGFTLKINSKSSFDIFSTNSKNSELTKKYGKDIFGLTETSKETFGREVMQPELVREVKKILKV